MIRGVTRRILGRRRRQQERQKSNWFRLANNNFARVSRFFVHFFAVTALLRRENAYFHVLWRTWTQDHDFLFLLLNFDTIFKNWSPDKNYQHLTNWTRWNKRDKVKSSATSLLEWRFRSRRRRCCLSSLLPHLSGVPHLHVNRPLVSVAGHNAEKPKEESERNAWPDFWFTVSTSLPAISYVVIKDELNCSAGCLQWTECTFLLETFYRNTVYGRLSIISQNRWPFLYETTKEMRDIRIHVHTLGRALNHNIQVRIFCF